MNQSRLRESPDPRLVIILLPLPPRLLIIFHALQQLFDAWVCGELVLFGKGACQLLYFPLLYFSSCSRERRGGRVDVGMEWRKEGKRTHRQFIPRLRIGALGVEGAAAGARPFCEEEGAGGFDHYRHLICG